MNAIALLLAAGGSERMGSPKALLPWRGQPLLSHQLQQIRKSGVSECVVVLGTGADRLAPLVRPSFGQSGKTRSVINPRHESRVARVFDERARCQVAGEECGLGPGRRHRPPCA